MKTLFYFFLFSICLNSNADYWTGSHSHDFGLHHHSVYNNSPRIVMDKSAPHYDKPGWSHSHLERDMEKGDTGINLDDKTVEPKKTVIDKTTPKSNKPLSVPSPTPVVVTRQVSNPKVIVKQLEPEVIVEQTRPKLSTTPEIKQKIKPIIADPTQVIATEWILIDQGMHLPQWIEFYNSGNIDINIKGWKFYYWVNNSIQQVIFKDFNIPAKQAVIFIGNRRNNIKTLNEDTNVDLNKVYKLNLKENFFLRKGWKLTTEKDTIIHAIGEKFTGELNTCPQVGDRNKNSGRISYKNYLSSDPENLLYYGDESDISHPTHHEPIRSAPMLKRKQISIWAELKR